MTSKAIALLSGGLDSILAVRLTLNQRIEVQALNFVTPFCTCNRQGRCEAQHVGNQLGFHVQVIPLRDEFFEVLKHPRFGCGSGMNPCLDCRILMFSRAKQRMEEIGADSVFTGEVLGQRPMSQHRRAMCLIDRESGLEGRLLRPLSAKLLEPTIPEKEGIVDREKLLAIEGRSRKEQMPLATECGMADSPCPAGGCRLTDPSFARRMRDLVERKPDFDLNDVNLLRIGRHFRLSLQTKAVVGRNEEENHRLLILAQQADLLFEVTTCGSPLTLLRGETDGDSVRRTAAITARYSDAPGPDVQVWYSPAGATLEEKTQAAPMDEPQLIALRI